MGGVGWLLIEIELSIYNVHIGKNYKYVKMKTVWPLELLEDERLCTDQNMNTLSSIYIYIYGTVQAKMITRIYI